MKNRRPPEFDPARLRKRLPRRYRYVRFRWRVLFGAIDFLGGLVFGFFGLLGVLRHFRPFAWRRAEKRVVPRRILLVQLDHLGDAILSTPLIEGLSQSFPQAAIEVLASKASAGWFQMLPQVTRVHVLEANRFAREGRGGWIGAIFAWGLRLRKRRFDLAIDVRGDFPIAVLMWLTGASRRVGWTSGGGGFLLTDAPAWVPNRHEIESRQALLKCIDPAADHLTPPFESLRGRFAGRRYFLKHSHFSRLAVLAHLSAGTPAKRWPAEHWRELIDLLDAQGAKVVLVGGEDARIIRDQAVAGTSWNRVEDRVGATDLEELARLAAQSDVVVGADSAVVHLAAALGTPVVVLFSGTNRPEQWRPWGERVTLLRQATPCSPCHLERCPLQGHACMRELLPNAVFQSIAAAPELDSVDSNPGKKTPPESTPLGVANQ